MDPGDHHNRFLSGFKKEIVIPFPDNLKGMTVHQWAESMKTLKGGHDDG